MLIATSNFRPNFLIEKELINKANKSPYFIAGIDEAGRGPLSGPVVAASVILDPNDYPDELNDSKKLSPQKRQEIFLKLTAKSKFGIGIVDEAIIDEINILNATKLAMKKAFEDLCNKYKFTPDFVIVDGNFVPQVNCPAQSFIKGDAKSLSIAAASIIAKETRDGIMRRLHDEFPQYNWKQNQGYPTQEHYEAIEKFGICKYHRKSFRLI